jgi:HAD superfamily hydrolase (TIGR01509 family)
MIKAVIFDVDGTLVDTVDMHALAWQRAFAEFGKEIEFSDIRDQIGKGGDQLMPVFLSESELDEFGKRLEKRRGDIYKSDYLKTAKPFPMVRELFERIRADGKKVALGSSAPQDELDHYLELTNVGDLIEADTSGDDAENSKPEPDIFLAAMSKIGKPDPADCIIIGDSPYDAEAAGKGGSSTIGFLSGGFSETSLRDAGCIEIYDGPADLFENYERSAIALGLPARQSASTGESG